MNKSKEGDMYWLNLPEDGKKLKAPPEHPCIITGHNDDDTTKVVGCTSKEKKHLGDIKVETTPEDMNTTTYARVYDKERDINNKEFTEKSRDRLNRSCKNLDEIKSKLKEI